jgi:hypothetical protein
MSKTRTTTKEANMARKNTTQDICFYGNRNVGFDFLATLNGEIFGQPSPEVLRFGTLTECLFTALRELRERGARGTVALYAPGGELCSSVKVGEFVSWGSLKWTAAPVYVLSVEAIEAAAE